MVQCFCPNRGLIDRNWEDALQEFIPRMQQAAATEYHLPPAKPIADISGTRGVAGSSVVSNYWGLYRPPARG